MTAYAAPLRDMQFVLEELIGLDGTMALPGCDHVTPDLVRAVLGEAARFGEEVLAPLNRAGDLEGCTLANGVVSSPKGFAAAYKAFCAGGWNAVPFEERYGGQALPWLVATPIGEIWDSANLAFSLCPMLTQGAADLLATCGTEAQKETYLPKLVSGEWAGTMNLTEPQAGSDVGALRTRAVPEGDHWRLKGQKIFITWGEHDMAENIVHLVLARIEGAPAGIKGVSLFLVPKYLVRGDGAPGERNDLRCVSLEHKLGIHGSPTAVMSYGEDGGAVGYLIGEPNRGIEAMFRMMNTARLNVGREGVGIGERAYQQAREYAKTRIQGRDALRPDGAAVTIIHHPDVRRNLLLMRCQIEAARALTYLTAASLDASLRHPEERVRALHRARVDVLTPVVKAWPTDLAVEIASSAVQVHGGAGYVEETGVAQHYRDARITPIYEGTNGIQAIDLVRRKVLGDRGASLRALMADMRALRRTLPEGLADVSRALGEGMSALRRATDWLIGEADPAAALAAATPYLRLVGIVTGGYLMTRAAAVAESRLANGGEDAPFYVGKRATARFYAQNVLPLASALEHSAIHGGRAALALAPEHI
jgi:alkylation response protein AidB-like acyl-CoA dehydrogenase